MELTSDHSCFAIALNAAAKAVPEWLHVIPAGQFTAIDGRGPFEVTAANAEQVIAAFNADGKKLPVDENHSTDLAAKKGFSAPARGWVVELEARDTGVWGRVEWTAEGRSLVEGQAYGYLSPVLLHGSKKPFVVQKLLRVALTNDPALTSLKALYSKGSAVDMEELLAALRTELELGADADGAAVLDGVKKLKVSRNSADPAQFVPIAMFQSTVAELNKLRSGVSLQGAERIVARAIEEGQIMPFMKDWAVSLCQSNAAAFDDFLNGAGKPIAAFGKSLTLPAADWNAMHQRGRGDISEVTEISRQLGHSAEDIQKYGAKANS